MVTFRSTASVRGKSVLKASVSKGNFIKTTNVAEFIAAAASPSNIPNLSGLPEVVVTGRANCGKSSLFNAVLGRRSLLETSKKAVSRALTGLSDHLTLPCSNDSGTFKPQGRTRSLNFYRVGAEPGKLVLVDAPGYGARGRPEWGELFDKYMETRKELKRVYILFNAKHPLNCYDTMMLSHLSQILVSQRERFTLQAIITKIDCVRVDEVPHVIKRIREDIEKVTPLCMPPILTSSKMQPPFGIEEVRMNIEQVCGLRS